MRRPASQPIEVVEAQQAFHAIMQQPGTNYATSRRAVSALRGGAMRRVCQRSANASPLATPHMKTFEMPGSEGPIQVPYVDIPGALQEKVNRRPAFRDQFRLACRRNNQRVTLIHYADESTGGNVLGAHLRRKAMCSYCSILEMDMLWIDAWWLPFSLMRSEDFDQIADGYGAVLRKLLEIIHAETVDGFPMHFPHPLIFSHARESNKLQSFQPKPESSVAIGCCGNILCPHVLPLTAPA